MLIENIEDKKFKSIPAHGGKGLIDMKFFHQEFQHFRGVDDLPEPAESYIKTQWNFVAYAELPEGATIGEHFHADNDEFYIILSGKAIMTIDGEAREIRKNDIILTRAGSRHSVEKVMSKLEFIAFEVLQK